MTVCTQRGVGVVLTLGVLLSACLERELKPLNPCLVSGVTRSVSAKNIDKIDLLFMVDNSGSMREEQEALRDQFPKLIRTLTTGDRSARGLPMFSPVTDMHLGVVSSDMGTPGVVLGKDCAPDGGDDGKLKHQSSGAPGCAANYPSFLTYKAMGGNPDIIASDFACIAVLGTGGCGIEQQLEAPLKALWPTVYTDAMGEIAPNPIRFLSTTAVGTMGRGDVAAAQGGSLGFLRNETKTGISLIAIVVVTDEEDCSFKDNALLQGAANAPDINIRCAKNPEYLYSVKDRYFEGFRGLRPGNPDLVVFAAIVGVPEDLVNDSARKNVDFSKDEQRNAYYDRILGDSRMQQEFTTDSNGQPALRASCTKPAAVPGGKPQTADPPRRIVELAKLFGENGIVQSICQTEFGGAMDAIIDAIAIHLKPVCLPRPLVRKQDGTVGCKVIWELPRLGEAPESTPTQCVQHADFLASAGVSSSTRGERCEVKQLAVAERMVPSARGDGWYYDDFAADLSTQCLPKEPQRISFTPGATPPTGVIVKLECLDEIQKLPNLRSDLSLSVKQPEIGTPCGTDTAVGAAHEETCVLTLQDGTEDASMFCHPERNVCVKACTSATECPAAWDCDQRPETLAHSGPRGGFCVNPTCGGETVEQ